MVEAVPEEVPLASVEELKRDLLTPIREVAYENMIDNQANCAFIEVDGEDGGAAIAEKVILTSYPRSGNTLLRTYLEKITGVHTGSDCDLRRPLNMQLKKMGLAGEGTLDSKVWVVKTHYPERIGRVKFNANKCIVIVRNPLDSIFSLFNMVGTTSHNASLSAQVLEQALHHSTIWTDFIRQEASVWVDFHDYWCRGISQIPVHFVTYESLL